MKYFLPKLFRFAVAVLLSFLSVFSFAQTIQATNVSFSSTTATGTSLSWTNGNGSKRAVFVKATSSGTPVPTDNTTYTANTAFGSGTQIGATGWFCVFNGTGTSVSITGLSVSTTYRAMVVEYNGGGGAETYLTSTGTNNPNNVSTPSSDANLSALAISNGTLSPSFTGATTAYTATVSNAVTSITLTPTVNEGTATVKVNGTTVASGTSSLPINLVVGSNTITTTVTAGDGTTTKTYIITVTRQPVTPTITSFTATSGPVGTLVTISGTNLSNPTGITIGGVSAIVISNTDTNLVAMVMPGATTGVVSVSTVLGTANSTGNFTVIASQAPNKQQVSLVGTGGSSEANQGYSVALSADGNTAIVGGAADNGGNGAAWVYTRNGGVWLQQGAKLVGTGSIFVSSTYNVHQGSSVALSADGNTAIVGGPGDNGDQGAAWVYTRIAGVWTQQGPKLVGTDAKGISPIQGSSVALSADGNMAIVGGPGDNASQGAAWVYTRIAGVWTQQGSKLVGTGVVGNGRQGISVALSGDGNTAIVGGNTDNGGIGAGWVFTRSAGVWTQQGAKLWGSGSGQGRSVALNADGNTAIVGAPGDNGSQGAAWVYTRTAGTWTGQAKLVGTDNIGAAQQGISVSLSGDGNTAIVGGQSDNSSRGAAWVYTRIAGTWTQQGSKLVGTGGVGNAQQGFSVALSADGNTAIAGGNTNQGAAWVYTYLPSTASDANLSALAISNGTLNPAFAGATTSYTVTVSNSVSSITLTPTKNETSATITVNGTTVASGTSSLPINLTVGANTITITVTAGDGTTTKSYVITVTRAAQGTSNDANLSALGISNGTLSPSFAGATTAYTATVSNAVTSITLTPTVNEGAATVKVNGTTVASGTSSLPINLVVGSNTITTTVTAGDGTTTKTYIITVTRQQALPPTILSFTSASGPVGSLVTISGTNLGNPTAVTIGGVSAIVISNTGTNLVAMVMPGATTGVVSVSTAGGTINSTSNFRVIATKVPSVQQGDKLVGTGNTGSAAQGVSVALSADGNTAVVGGNADNGGIGAVWIYTRNAGVWTQQGPKLVGTGNIGSSSQGDAVAISADGNTVIVGARGDNGQLGAAWVFTRTAGVWTQQGAKLVGTNSGSQSQQGASVALSADGNTAIVGSVLAGGAWVYTRTAGVWTQQGAKLVGTGGVGGTSYQGWSVAISADGNTAMIGGPADNTSPAAATGQGAAWVFTRSAGSWTQQGAKLVGTGGTGNAQQGWSVALSADGNTAIVGGQTDNANDFSVGPGAAWVYTRNAGVWTQQGSKLVGTGIVGTANQGYSVALSADGNTAMVGGNIDNSGQGAAWVYRRNAGAWTQQGAKLVGTGGTVTAKQGSTVALSADGNTAMVGGLTAGAAWAYTYLATLSSDASLSALEISNGTLSPSFSAATTSYTVTVGNSVNSVTVTPTTNDETAIVTVNGTAVPTGASSLPINLVVGTNTISTTVKAGDGITTKSYVITVIRTATGASDATLSALAISNGTLSPAFAGSTTVYSATVSNTVTFITLTPTRNESSATITVNGTTVASGTSSLPINLVVGANTITTTVTAGDGTTVKTYVITITRGGSSNANLSALSISNGTLSPSFTSGTTGYAASVSNGTPVITVTPTKDDAAASITVNGTAVVSGVPSLPINLVVGANTITVTVTASDGTTKNYTITVTRASLVLPNNADLSALSVSAGTLSPSFGSAITSYTVNIPENTGSVKITPTAAEFAASIKVNNITVVSGSASGDILTSSNVTVATIAVTSQDGTTVKTYTVTFIRPVTTWTGSVNNEWLNSGNWTNGVPDITKLAIIPASIKNPIIGTTEIVKNISISASAGITITGTLQVTGDVTLNGSITGSGIAVMVGNIPQTISGTGTFNNLTINNVSGVSISAGNGNIIGINGILRVANGVLSTNDNLILRSDASGTASVAALPGNNRIVGNVTVQRWMTAQRGYRAFGHPFNTALSLNQLTDNFAISGSGNGFVTGLGYSTSSVSYYDSVASSAAAFKKPLSNAPLSSTDPIWSVNRGILALVRGKGTEGLAGNYVSSNQPTAFAVDAIGVLNQGALNDYQLGANTTGTSFNLVGNPYAAPINIKLLKSNSGQSLFSNNGANGVGNTIYVYNPFKNAGISSIPSQEVRGGLDAYTNDGNTDIIIPSFGAFFIQAKAAGNVIKFDETAKAVVSKPLNIMGGTGDVPKLTLTLEDDHGSWDDIKLRWDKQAGATGTDNYDGTKMSNELLDFYSISSDLRKLCIDSRSDSLNKEETIPLGIKTTVTGNSFRIGVGEYSLPANVIVVLKDKFLHTETVLGKPGDTYAFEINSDSLSKGDNRFELFAKLKPTITPAIDMADGVKFLPNPFIEELVIQLGKNAVGVSENTTVRLVDLQGRIIKSLIAAPGTNLIRLTNCSALTAGVYVVEIRNDKINFSKQVIKQ